MAQVTSTLLDLPIPFGAAGGSVIVYKTVLSEDATTATINVGKNVVFNVPLVDKDNVGDCPIIVDQTTTPGTLTISAVAQNGTFYLLVLTTGS